MKRVRFASLVAGLVLAGAGAAVPVASAQVATSSTSSTNSTAPSSPGPTVVVSSDNPPGSFEADPPPPECGVGSTTVTVTVTKAPYAADLIVIPYYETSELGVVAFSPAELGPGVLTATGQGIRELQPCGPPTPCPPGSLYGAGGSVSGTEGFEVLAADRTPLGSTSGGFGLVAEGVCPEAPPDEPTPDGGEAGGGTAPIAAPAAPVVDTPDYAG